MGALRWAVRAAGARAQQTLTRACQGCDKVRRCGSTRSWRGRRSPSSRSSSSRRRPTTASGCSASRSSRCASSSRTSCRSPTARAARRATGRVKLTKWIKQELGIETMAHLTCVGASRDELHAILRETGAAGIDNVLALRGDPPRGETELDAAPRGTDARGRARRADRGRLRLLASARRASRRCTSTRPTSPATSST